MKINKKSALAAVLMTTTFFITGCSSGAVGENPPKVSSNIFTEKYTFKDSDKTFKFVYSDPWRAVSDKGYSIAVIPGEDAENADIKLSIKSEELPQERSDLESAAEYYSQIMNTGIVQNSKFTVKGAEGYWISYTPLEESGFEVSGIDTEKINNEEIIEVGFVIKDSRAYVFKVTAKDYQTLKNNKDSVYNILEGFDFI